MFLTRISFILIKVRQEIFNKILITNIGNISLPFNINFNVEMRNYKNIKIGKECTIKSNTILNGRSESFDFGIELGENTYIKEGCYFDSYGGRISIAGKCAFGKNTIIHGGGTVEIGKYSIFGSNCYIISSNHNHLSRELPIMLQGDSAKGIKIGNNVWVGGGVIILDGVTIGNNCVIGAGAIITKDIPTNTKVVNKVELLIKGMYK